ncbi:hypothetical protein OEA41_008644 [Lepraria neglecta]|uniref:Uncharacterized protein n=1 Tax=Lepraria neglecta TaxID=209136 RepID=A0AAD9Z0H9_9LECA|nr:hypothetical protein OEA41_008644 [Lepraria neglecta]
MATELNELNDQAIKSEELKELAEEWTLFIRIRWSCNVQTKLLSIQALHPQRHRPSAPAPQRQSVRSHKDKRVTFEEEQAAESSAQAAKKGKNDKEKGGGGSKRQPPPKPVHLRWGPSDVEQRAVEKASAVAELQAARRRKAQELAYRTAKEAQVVEQEAIRRREQAALKKAAQPNIETGEPYYEERRGEDKEDREDEEDRGEDEEDDEDEEDEENDPDQLIDEQEEDSYITWLDLPYPYRVNAALKATTKTGTTRPRWAAKIGDDDWMRGEFNSQSLAIEVYNAMDKHRFEEEFDRITVRVKSDYTKAQWQLISTDDLSQEEWDQKVEKVLRQEWRRKPGYTLEATVEYVGNIRPLTNPGTPSSTRPIDAVDDPLRSPPRRRTRTNQLEDQQAHLRDEQEQAGSWLGRLTDRPQPSSQSSFQPPPQPPPQPVTLAPDPCSASAPEQPPQRSSPIANRTEEEQAMDDFWAWKNATTSSDEKRRRLATARAIVEANMWTIVQLKQMSDTSSKLCTRASQLELPDGLIRGFREDLREFKSLCCDVLRPGRLLTQLGVRGHQLADQLYGAAGGFVRE